MDTITVWYNGSAMIISKFVANSLGIKDHHRIGNESEFWNILQANASYNLTAIKAITSTSKN